MHPTPSLRGLATATTLLGLAVAGAAAQGPTVHVPHANAKVAGIASPDVLTTKINGVDVRQAVVASGPMAVENPGLVAGVANASHYGYFDDGPMVAAPGAVQQPGVKVEATKSEPDKNTYLVLAGQTGPDASYDYGSHFLFQGHEVGLKGSGSQPEGYITRINLDADVAHRVTVLATKDANGRPIPNIDGSTWDPFAKVLLFTAERGTAGGVWQATSNFPSTVKDISNALGRGGFEGVQIDRSGNLWVVEDVGGSSGAVNTKAKQPNSFVYRFVPADPADLTLGGAMQVLQVDSLASPGHPILFHAGQADADITSQDVLDLHTYGKTFTTRWITIHDTAADGFERFDANAAAKLVGGTPFKRPENGVFRPGTAFTQFVFTETGDTNALTQAGSQLGGFGALFTLTQANASADTGTLTMLFRCDLEHTGFDNITFLTKDVMLVTEDAGDTLHSQRNALDSLYAIDATVDYGAVGAPAPIRVLAEGRDVSATFDSALLESSSTNGFQNEGDNEITGIHASDGDSTVQGLLGVIEPTPFKNGWRVFWTRQHGENATYEIVTAGR